nr:TonB-dependent siderophore receptor [Acetobacter okinawensis]
MDRPVEFHVSGGDLDHALTQAADQSGVHIFFPSASVMGKKSVGLSGKLTVNQALARLLSGSGLSWHLQDGKTIIVSASSNINLGPVRVGGQISKQDPTGPGVGYVATTTMAGTKTDTPILEIPNSIYIITKQQMVDQQPQNVQEALRYSPGVYAEANGTYAVGAAANSGGTISQRGFHATQFVDGLMSTSQAAGETAFLDRIEVVNGPASVMYGQVTPGGMIGMSLKKPTDTPFHQVSLGFGNWGRYEATFDVSDKVTKSGNVRYRIAGIGVTQGTQMDHVDYHRVGILPSITWDIDQKTSLTLLGSYTYTPGTGEAEGGQYPVQGTLVTDGYPRISRKTFLGFQNYNESSVKDAMFEYQFEHKFNKYIKFSQIFRWEKSEYSGNYAYYDGSVSADDLSYEYLVPYHQHMVTNSEALDSRLYGKLKTGPVTHTWVVGSDFRNYENSQDPTNSLEDIAVNVYNPTASSYTPCMNVSSYSGCGVHYNPSQYNYFQEGIYFQDQIKWRKLSVLWGGREDWVNYSYSASTYSNINSSNVETKTASSSAGPMPQHAFTWRAGLVYQFKFGLAPYFSYSTSFVPQNSTNWLGQPFAPLTGKQFEVGLKYKVPNKNILLTASAFHILEDHYLISDLVHGGSEDAGSVKSQGFELSAHANITKDLRVIASYSYTDIRYAKTNKTAKRYNLNTSSSYGAVVSQEGMSVPYVPRNMFSVFADYMLPSSVVKGVGINGGIRYVGFTYVDNVESFKSPAYLLFDIGAHYDLGEATPILKGLKAQLAISNLTNKYYTTSCSDSVCYLGQGRRVYGNLTYNW